MSYSSYATRLSSYRGEQARSARNLTGSREAPRYSPSVLRNLPLGTSERARQIQESRREPSSSRTPQSTKDLPRRSSSDDRRSSRSSQAKPLQASPPPSSSSRHSKSRSPSQRTSRSSSASSSSYSYHAGLISYASLLPPPPGSPPRPQMTRVALPRHNFNYSSASPRRNTSPHSASPSRSNNPDRDDTDSRFDSDDSDWQAGEYSSGISSDSSESSSSSDSDEDGNSDSLPDCVPLPERKRKLPKLPKRVPLLPIATHSRKRASLREAYARRWGPLFPPEMDPPEMQTVLSSSGKLGDPRLVELMTPLPPDPVRTSRVRLTKKERARLEREARISTSTCACSHVSESTIVTEVSDLFEASVPSNSCPSCSSTPASPSPVKQQLKLPTFVLTTPRPQLDPIDPSQCPLLQAIESLKAEELAHEKWMKEQIEQQEEAAYQRSLLPHPVIFPWTPIEVDAEEDQDPDVPRIVDAPWVAERKEREAREVREREVRKRRSEAEITHLEIFAKKACHILAAAGVLEREEPASVPTAAICIEDLAAATPTKSFTTLPPHGYRTSSPLVNALFPHLQADQDELNTQVIVQFETYPSHPAGWTTDRCRRRSKHHHHKSHHEHHHRPRPRLVEDVRFWRVLAIENQARNQAQVHAANGGSYPVTLATASKAMGMSSGYLRVRVQKPGKSPLKHCSLP